MSEETQESARPRLRWLKRIGIGVGVYLLVGFLTSFLGLNLLGAVFFSGPLIGRVTDANGRGIPGAFVSYEWRGQSYHGSTGCKAAAIVRSRSGGFYFIPWQGWRLVFATGWGISPVGPAVWAPGYRAKLDGNGGTVLMSEHDTDTDPRVDANESVDKGICFGPSYRSQWIELRFAGLKQSYERTCEAKASLKVGDLKSLQGGLIGIAMAQRGEYTTSSQSTAALTHKYDIMLQTYAWPKSVNDPDALVTSEQREDFCASVRQDFLAQGGSFDER